MLMMKKILLFVPLLLLAVAASAEPIVRVVSTSGPDKAFATDNVRKLVLSADAVDVVNSEGSVLLSVPKSDIARVEFGDGTPDTPTAINDVQSDDVQGTKVLRDGQLYILFKGAMYNVQGQKVTMSR